MGKCVFFARVAGDIDRPIAPQINQRSHGQPYPAGIRPVAWQYTARPVSWRRPMMPMPFLHQFDLTPRQRSRHDNPPNHGNFPEVCLMYFVFWFLLKECHNMSRSQEFSPGRWPCDSTTDSSIRTFDLFNWKKTRHFC